MIAAGLVPEAPKRYTPWYLISVHPTAQALVLVPNPERAIAVLLDGVIVVVTWRRRLVELNDTISRELVFLIPEPV